MQRQELPCRYRVDNLGGIQAAVQAGIGVSVLPCYLADSDPSLVRLTEPIRELESELWLLTHPDLRSAGRIRALMEWIAGEIREQQQRLQGTSMEV